MSLEYGTFYEVADTGLFLGGGREGGFSIVFKEGKYFVNTMRIDGCSDCIQSVYDAILKYAPYPLPFSFLKRYESTIRKTTERIWEDMKSHYDFPKCFNCTVITPMKNEEDCWAYDYSAFSEDIFEHNSSPVFDINSDYEIIEDIDYQHKSDTEKKIHELFFSDMDYIVESISDFFKSNHVEGIAFLNQNGELVLHTTRHYVPKLIDELSKQKRLDLIRFQKCLTANYIDNINEVDFYYYFLERR